MTIAAKLVRLTEVMNKAALARKAGLPDMAITNIIIRNRQTVRFATAKALAEVLEVDVVWLLDNDQDWPPIRVEQKAVA